MTAQGNITAGGGLLACGSLSFVYSCFFHLVRLPSPSSSHTSISSSTLSSSTSLLVHSVSQTPSSTLKKLYSAGEACNHESRLQEVNTVAIIKIKRKDPWGWIYFVNQCHSDFNLSFFLYHLVNMFNLLLLTATRKGFSACILLLCGQTHNPALVKSLLEFF